MIFYGPLSDGYLGLADADVLLLGQDHGIGYEGFGHSIATGDFTGDSIPDVAVGVNPRGITVPPRVYVFPGPLTGTRNAGDGTVEVLGLTLRAETSRNPLAGGDLNGDGIGDLVSRKESGGSAVYMGPFAGVQQEADIATFALTAPSPGSVGIPLWFGDVNGDGLDDVIARGNYDPDPEPEGFNSWSRLQVLLGSTTGVFEEAVVLGVGWEDQVWDRYLPAGEGEAYSQVAGGGVLVGAPHASQNEFDNEGRALLLQLE